jgi:hypothetical protein
LFSLFIFEPAFGFEDYNRDGDPFLYSLVRERVAAAMQIPNNGDRRCDANPEQRGRYVG